MVIYPKSYVKCSVYSDIELDVINLDKELSKILTYKFMDLINSELDESKSESMEYLFHRYNDNVPASVFINSISDIEYKISVGIEGAEDSFLYDIGIDYVCREFNKLVKKFILTKYDCRFKPCKPIDDIEGIGYIILRF